MSILYVKFIHMTAVFLVLIYAATADNENPPKTISTTAPVEESSTKLSNETHSPKDNKTESSTDNLHFRKPSPMNVDALKRASYVILIITFIVIVYFVIRAVRLRRNTKAHRYKIVSRKGDAEMAPLGQSEEDSEDATIFEVNHPFVEK